MCPAVPRTLEELDDEERVFAEESIVTDVASPAEFHLAPLPREFAQHEALQI